jgi:hypothetical protein
MFVSKLEVNFLRRNFSKMVLVSKNRNIRVEISWKIIK